MKRQKGFTIIELVVVIAIIAILASIIIIGVTGYINKAKNSVIKSNMGTLTTNAVLFYSSNSLVYTGFDTDTTYGCGSIGSIYTSISSQGGALSCHVKSTHDAWCACTTLNTTSNDSAGSVLCVDSTGASKELVTGCSIECPTGGSCQ